MTKTLATTPTNTNQTGQLIGPPTNQAPDARTAAATQAVGFGERLRQYRQAAGLSLRQLAARAGYDHSYLSQVERGQRPGSADLARRCDQELGAGGRLITGFEQRSAAPRWVDRPGGGDSLESAWRGLVVAVGAHGGPGDVLGDIRSVPPAVLLPELVSVLQACDNGDPQAVELSVLIAETLAGLGECATARRWWWAAQAAADSAVATNSAGGSGGVGSAGAVGLAALVRARAVISGLGERQSLAGLLRLADETVAMDRRAPDAAGFLPLAARALVLAELGVSEDAGQALRELVGAGDKLLVSDTLVVGDTCGRRADVVGREAARQGGARLLGPLPYQLHWVEGLVSARLGYGIAGCVLLARARELCAEGWHGERAGLELGLAECLVAADEVPAGLALALRVLVELPDEWHSLWVADAARRVLQAVEKKEPARRELTELRRLLARLTCRSGRSMGAGSRGGVGAG
ncbi:helix-turn-helix domain-containing protein [Kribbella solani]|uniref:HTH cro/C1-type domain-containing protein n=1 Tax=Kribbella solani TaxID=236067 RepID=A0A841E3W9_9ACTN|nr:hypothetical protein [Kribbella solani]